MMFILHIALRCLVDLPALSCRLLEFVAILWNEVECSVTNDEVLTIKEVAALLKLAEKNVYSMSQRGEIPVFKVRGQWRVRRSEMETWMDEQPRGG